MKNNIKQIITGFLSLMLAFFSPLIYKKYFILLGLDEKTDHGAGLVIYMTLFMTIMILLILTVYPLVKDKTEK